ncbi:MAG: tol-pal system YbgF family protein [Nitrospinaceae bacterium]
MLGLDPISLQPPAGIHPEEMYAWTPPSEEVLAQRRQTQVELDALAAAIDNLLSGLVKIELDATNLRVAALAWPSRVQAMERTLTDGIDALAGKNDETENWVTDLLASFGRTQGKLRSVKEKRQRQRLLMDKYRRAFLLFRETRFQESANQFKVLLQKKFPKSLRDNLLFGLAAALYKMKKYSAAARHLEALMRQGTRVDKWHEGSLLLGLVYQRDSRSSRALYILERALRENPPASIRKLMERLASFAKKGIQLGHS